MEQWITTIVDALQACAAFPVPAGLESLEHPSTHVFVGPSAATL